jgi:hypothetical protein
MWTCGTRGKLEGGRCGPRWVAEWWLCGAARSWYGMVCLNGTSGMKDDVFQELV